MKSNRQSLKSIKLAVYAALGVSTTKQVKRQFKGYDLRSRASWLAILAQCAPAPKKRITTETPWRLNLHGAAGDKAFFSLFSPHHEIVTLPRSVRIRQLNRLLGSA